MFKISSYTKSGAEVIMRRYIKMGYKHISIKYDKKKEMYVNTFKDNDAG